MSDPPSARSCTSHSWEMQNLPTVTTVTLQVHDKLGTVSIGLGDVFFWGGRKKELLEILLAHSANAFS